MYDFYDFASLHQNKSLLTRTAAFTCCGPLTSNHIHLTSLLIIFQTIHRGFRFPCFHTVVGFSENELAET